MQIPPTSINHLCVARVVLSIYYYYYCHVLPVVLNNIEQNQIPIAKRMRRTGKSRGFENVSNLSVLSLSWQRLVSFISFNENILLCILLQLCFTIRTCSSNRYPDTGDRLNQDIALSMHSTVSLYSDSRSLRSESSHSRKESKHLSVGVFT